MPPLWLYLNFNRFISDIPKTKLVNINLAQHKFLKADLGMDRETEIKSKRDHF